MTRSTPCARTNRPGGTEVALCKHCVRRIELIDTAGDGDVWMHVEDSGVPAMPRSLYRTCRLPPQVAEPG